MEINRIENKEISANPDLNSETIVTMDKKPSHNNPSPNKSSSNKPNSDDDVNVLSGDNKVDVGITPDLKNIRVQFCSCSIVFNCFSRPYKDE